MSIVLHMDEIVLYSVLYFGGVGIFAGLMLWGCFRKIPLSALKVIVCIHLTVFVLFFVLCIRFSWSEIMRQEYWFQDLWPYGFLILCIGGLVAGYTFIMPVCDKWFKS